MRNFKLNYRVSATGLSVTDARQQLKPLEQKLKKLAKSNPELVPIKLIWVSQEFGHTTDYGASFSTYWFGITFSTWDDVNQDAKNRLTAIIEEFVTNNALEPVEQQE